MNVVRVFYDCEFIERGPEVPLRLISIGMVRDPGHQEMYRINLDVSPAQVYRVPWLYRNVWPLLPMKVEGDGVLSWDVDHPDYQYLSAPEQIALDILDFCRVGEDDSLELWAEFGAYDHVCLAQLFGPMEDFPADQLPSFTRDLRQRISDVGYVGNLPEPAVSHNALGDARALKSRFDAVEGWRITQEISRNADEMQRLHQSLDSARTGHRRPITDLDELAGGEYDREDESRDS